MDILDRVLEMERQGRDIVHLEKGELDFETPAAVLERAVEAMREGRTRYTSSTGLPELREAIAARHGAAHGTEVSPEQVIVNSGSSAVLLSVFLALFADGGEFAIPDPGYTAYRHYVEAVHGEVVHVPTADHGFRYDAELVRPHLTNRTQAVFVNFPSNPLGAVADDDQLAGFAELGPLVISDEVYDRLDLREGVRARSMLEFTDRAVVLNSFSKSFAMTGWRLGYAIVPRDAVRALRRVQQSYFISPNAFVQWAGIAALEYGDAARSEWIAELRERRDLLHAGLLRLGFRVPAAPEGAFYVFAQPPGAVNGSVAFSAALLHKAGVATVPGSDFGPGGEGYLRFSYSTSVEWIAEGLERIGAFLEAGW